MIRSPSRPREGDWVGSARVASWPLRRVEYPESPLRPVHQGFVYCRPSPAPALPEKRTTTGPARPTSLGHERARRGWRRRSAPAARSARPRTGWADSRAAALASASVSLLCCHAAAASAAVSPRSGGALPSRPEATSVPRGAMPAVPSYCARRDRGVTRQRGAGSVTKIRDPTDTSPSSSGAVGAHGCTSPIPSQGRPPAARGDTSDPGGNPRVGGQAKDSADVGTVPSKAHSVRIDFFRIELFRVGADQVAR